jgi:hypothetical protein
MLNNRTPQLYDEWRYRGQQVLDGMAKLEGRTVDFSNVALATLVVSLRRFDEVRSELQRRKRC